MNKNKSTTCYICEAEATVTMNILNEERTKTIEVIHLCEKCSKEIQSKEPTQEPETKGKVTHAIAMNNESLPEGSDEQCEICITKKARTILHVQDINTEEIIKSKLCLLCSADLAIRTAIEMGGIDPTLLDNFEGKNKNSVAIKIMDAPADPADACVTCDMRAIGIIRVLVGYNENMPILHSAAPYCEECGLIAIKKIENTATLLKAYISFYVTHTCVSCVYT